MRRFKQFTILATVLLLAGVALHMLLVVGWPWWLYGMSAFVMSQALLKWLNSRWMICPHCGSGYTRPSR